MNKNIISKWIFDGHHMRCENCETSMCKTDRENDKIPRNFCPNCGAKMINAEEEE